MIIDAHLHLDDRLDGTAKSAAKELSRQLHDANIKRGVVLHLEAQPWSPEQFAEAIDEYPNLRGFVNINPNNRDANLSLRNSIEKLGFIGLKLHPRLQGFEVDSQQTINLVKSAGELGLPVLIDAFPDGTYLMNGFSPLKYANLARECPDTRIIWAHMGGHYVIDFMMLAKRLPNVYLDFSYSLLYYQFSSIPMNMVYAMKSLKFDRVFYGSDYPDRSIALSLDLSLSYLKSQGLSDSELNKIMGDNAKIFFNWNDL